MKVWIYCGVPGSGKTTFIDRRHAGAPVCSADDHFMVNGEYRFDPAKLPAAHAACLRKFVNRLQQQCDGVVVDNTNTTVAELAPYAALALAYGYELEIVTLHCDPVLAHSRNVHGVPLVAIEAMSKRLLERQIPPWWPHSETPMETGNP